MNHVVRLWYNASIWRYALIGAFTCSLLAYFFTNSPGSSRSSSYSSAQTPQPQNNNASPAIPPIKTGPGNNNSVSAPLANASPTTLQPVSPAPIKVVPSASLPTDSNNPNTTNTSSSFGTLSEEALENTTKPSRSLPIESE